MTYYRKRPVIIEAVHWNGANSEEVMAFTGDRARCVPKVFSEGEWVIVISTLEGDMTAVAGDYIIRGIAGELYSCRGDIFAKTYELVK